MGTKPLSHSEWLRRGICSLFMLLASEGQFPLLIGHSA
jgi:hypothetical protein